MLIVILSLVVFQACKKEDSDPNTVPQETVLDYYPLTVGNYWIYKVSRCDSTWTQCDSVRIDSNYVSKDTTINGLNYFKIEGGNFLSNEPLYIRDSLDYIVDSEGYIMFSSTDYDTKFSEEYIIVGNNDTIYHWYNKMDPEPFVVDVPLGEYTCLDNQLSFFRKKEDFKTEYNSHNAFSKNTGPVYESALFASNTSGYKRELVSYYIKAINTP